MKKCMSGCGGKMMSKGGKVSPVKKMQKGGALKPLGAKLGVGVNVAGMLGTGIKAISDRIKAKKAEKKEKEAALDKKQRGGVTKGYWEFNKDGSLKTFESERKKNIGKYTGVKDSNEKYKKIQEDIEKRTGKKSVTKARFQKGGGVQKIVGMPGYNANTNTMQKGGAKKYAKGGSTFGMLSVKAGIDKNPKPTAADRIAGAKKKNK